MWIFLGSVRENTPWPVGCSSVGRASDCRALQLSDGPWGAILHAEYDASCNYDELLLFVNTDTVSERLLPEQPFADWSTDETPGCLSRSGS